MHGPCTWEDAVMLDQGQLTISTVGPVRNAYRRSVTSIAVDFAPFFGGSLLKIALGTTLVVATSRLKRGA